MKKANSFFVFIFCFLVSYSQSQVRLDYARFLANIRQENPLAKKAYGNEEISTAQRFAAKGNYDPQLSAGYENKFFNSTDYFSSGNVELKQQLFTSQYLKLGYQYGQGNYIDPENKTPVSGIPYLGIQASLLQGLLFDKSRAELLKSRYYTEYYDAEEKIQLNDLLFVSSGSYVDYLYYARLNNLYRYFLDLAQSRLTGMVDLAVIGERPMIDTVEAAIFLQGKILDVKSAELELSKKQNELVSLLPQYADNPKMVIPSDSIDLIYREVLKRFPIRVLDPNSSNPLMVQYSAKQKVFDTELRLKKEMIKPILDVNYNFLASGYSGSLPAISPENYKWSAKLSFPLYLRKPRNEYKLAGVLARNNRYEMENKQLQLDSKRRYLLDAADILSQQIRNSEQSTRYSELLVEAERIKFSNGESSLFLLNSRENKWLETELKLLEYKTKFIRLYLELVYLDGKLDYEFN